jgi:peptide deformylase
MAPYAIRIVGDPVLRERANDITEIDDRLVKLIDDMFVTMYDAPGVGLAAPQVGVQKRLFVYDTGDDPKVLINPEITGSDGEWWFEEGCLSIPGQHFDICRPKEIEVSGVDLDGNEVSFEADEFLARVIQHELDHLNGVLMLEHLDEEQLKDAKRAIREYQLAQAAIDDGAESRAGAGGFRLR